MFRAYFDPSYVTYYRDLYVSDSFWAPKYRHNEAVIYRLLQGKGLRTWLDLFCGQGQYFFLAQTLDDVKCIGIDKSPAQLDIARAHCHARTEFVHADIQNLDLATVLQDAHLVTVMWGAYCYLAGPEEIRSMLKNVASILAPGGSFYLEVIEPTSLENFNSTLFARESGASVCVHGWHIGGAYWSYKDMGGTHQLFSPPLEWACAILRGAGLTIENITTVQTLHHVVATKKT